MILSFLERHRRSKHEQIGRIFDCECGKSFLSLPALNNHKKNKHPELTKGPKKGRGRPRKHPRRPTEDFENHRYDKFFEEKKRKKMGGAININKIVTNVYKGLFSGNHSNKLFSKPKNEDDIPILKNLKNSAEINTTKSTKNCNEVFYEYLVCFKDKTNEDYFTLLIQFVLLFREYYNISKNKNKDSNSKEEVTDKISPECLPELCNKFYGEFLEPNCFFEINEDQRLEIIEIIQHFCLWLFKNEYTKSKLSLAS